MTLFHSCIDSMTRFFKQAQELCSQVGRYMLMLSQIISLLFKGKLHPSLVVEQLYVIGVLSLPLVIMTGLATGMVLAAQAYFQLADKGLAATTGIMVAKSMLSEIGPVLTSFMLTGRVGAAIAAEIGSMKVSDQLDAMTSLGVSPIEQLVLPRVSAMCVMMPVLAVFSAMSGIFGGWLIACKFYGMSTQTFFDPVPLFVTWYDIFASVFKSWVFGFLIVTLSCFNGLHVKGGARGVGRATTLSVVLCYTTILTTNFFMTIGLNTCYWYIFGF